jgi:hypothetical protein
LARLTSQAKQSPARTPATAKSSATTVTAPAFRFRASFVNVHRPAVDLETIEVVDSGFCLSRVRHLNEGKSPRLPRVPVGHDIHAVNTSVLRKSSLQIGLGWSDNRDSLQKYSRIAFQPGIRLCLNEAPHGTREPPKSARNETGCQKDTSIVAPQFATLEVRLSKALHRKAIDGLLS